MHWRLIDTDRYQWTPRATAPPSTIDAALPSSTASFGCRGGSSSLELSEDLVRKWRVEVVGDDDSSFVLAQGSLARLGKRHEPGDRLASLRDDHFLAAGNTRKPLGQMSLRFVNIDDLLRLHKRILN